MKYCHSDERRHQGVPERWDGWSNYNFSTVKCPPKYFQMTNHVEIFWSDNSWIDGVRENLVNKSIKFLAEFQQCASVGRVPSCGTTRHIIVWYVRWYIPSTFLWTSTIKKEYHEIGQNLWKYPIIQLFYMVKVHRCLIYFILLRLKAQGLEFIKFNAL